MKFQPLFRVCLIFSTYDSANFKSIGNNAPRKMILLLRWPAYYRMCSIDVYCSKQTGAVAPKETITHHFFVSGIGQKKLSMQPKFVAAQKMLERNRNPANIRKWIARFYYFRHLYSAGSACVLLTIIVRAAHRYGQLYLHWSIYFCPSSCFCIVISLLRVK